MKNQYFDAVCAITCLFVMSHVTCYAEIKVADEKKSIHQLSSLDKEMRELYQFDRKYGEIRNLLLEKKIYFEDIKDYFFSNNNIKSFDFRTGNESLSYVGEVNEKDYIRLKNSVQSICSEKDNFDIGIGANYIGGTLIKNKANRNILFWKGDYSRSKGYYFYLEYLIYREDIQNNMSDFGLVGGHNIRKEISPQWYYTQSIKEIRMRDDQISEGNNPISNKEFPDKRLSYETIKNFLVNHSEVLENYVKSLRQNGKNEICYSNYIDFERIDDGQVYKNYNIISYKNAEQLDAGAMHYQQEINIIPYCKETEKFIAFLKKNNIILPIGASVETSFSEDGAFQFKIFTRSQLVNSKCFNVTIMYNSADKQIKTEPIVEENVPTWLSELITPKKPLEQELIPHWYYIEEIGRKRGLYQGK